VTESMTGTDADQQRPAAPGWRRLWPLLLLAVLALAAYATGQHRHFSAEALAENQERLAALVAANPMLAPVVFIVVYAAVIALSLPGGALLTMCGGLLFGVWLGGSFAVVGALVGAVLVFLAARHALAETLAARAAPALERIRPGLERDGFSYLLVLRLVPLFPFWLVNLAPALVGMRLSTYAAATAIGILPGTFVYAWVGSGLSQVLAAGDRPDGRIVLTPGVLLPLVGLAVLALVPVVVRRWRARRSGG